MSKKKISFEKLLEIPVDDMKIVCNDFIQKKLGLNAYCVEYVIYCPNESISRDFYAYKNYFDFKDLFELHSKKYPEEKFPEFPSRIAFTKEKEEQRMKYFEMFLNKILEEAKDETKREYLFDLLYNFILEPKESGIQKLTKEKIKAVY